MVKKTEGVLSGMCMAIVGFAISQFGSELYADVMCNGHFHTSVK